MSQHTKSEQEAYNQGLAHGWCDARKTLAPLIRRVVSAIESNERIAIDDFEQLSTLLRDLEGA